MNKNKYPPDFQNKVKEFAFKELRPKISVNNGVDRFPRDVWKAMSRYGLWGVPFPKKYGGTEQGYLNYILTLEEISREWVGIAATLTSHTLAAEFIFKYGTEKQKTNFLPRLLSGKYIGSVSFTEPSTGSDVLNIEVTATQQQDRIFLNGTKVLISNVTLSGIVLIVAKDINKNKSLSVFIVPKDSSGLILSPLREKMGTEGLETADCKLDNVSIPLENVLGEEEGRGRGFSMLLDVVNLGRLAVAAQSLGLAERAFEEGLKYSTERVQQGKPINYYQAIRGFIAEMATYVEAMRNMVYSPACLKDDGKDISLEAAMAKLFCASSAKKVIDYSLSIHGAYGYTKNFVIERLYREVKLCELYHGTPEIQKLVISSRKI